MSSVKGSQFFVSTFHAHLSLVLLQCVWCPQDKRTVTRIEAAILADNIQEVKHAKVPLNIFVEANIQEITTLDWCEVAYAFCKGMSASSLECLAKAWNQSTYTKAFVTSMSLNEMSKHGFENIRKVKQIAGDMAISGEGKTMYIYTRTSFCCSFLRGQPDLPVLNDWFSKTDVEKANFIRSEQTPDNFFNQKRQTRSSKTLPFSDSD